MKERAVFIDRDGTINFDGHFLDDPEKFEMYPGVGNGVKKLQDSGFKVIVVTNQSGIGRGHFTEEVLFEIHNKMEMEFKEFDVELDGIYYCPHHPEDNCRCRKPKPGMFEKAINEYNIDIEKSYMLGDRFVDVESGKNLGVRTILIPEEHKREDVLREKNNWEYHPDFISDDFQNAVDWILKTT